MKQVLIFFDRLICWFATHLYPEGKGVKEDLENYRITAKPLKVIANGNVNGKDMDYYNQIHFAKEDLAILRKKLGILTTDTVFIYVGRLINDKGVNELVDAFCTLSKKQENTKLLLVGSYDGETDILPEKTLTLIEKLDQIICVGQQQDIRPFLALSTIFVFPSYREGFPNVVIEAGAMGLPSIVTDINGSNEIIIHNKNGLIIPSKNTDALLKAMENLSNNNILIKELTKNARPMVVSRYDYKLVWAAQLAEYQSFFT